MLWSNGEVFVCETEEPPMLHRVVVMMGPCSIGVFVHQNWLIGALALYPCTIKGNVGPAGKNDHSNGHNPEMMTI